MHGVGGARPRSRSSPAPGSRCACAGATPCIRASARRSTCAASQPAAPGSYAPEDLRDGPARAGGADGGARSASCSRTIQEPHLRALLDARLRRGLGAVGAATASRPAAKYYHQAYRHGLLEHSPRRRAGGERDQRDVRRHRPRRRRHGRAAARHRQARGLRRRGAGDRPHRRRAPARRDRARLLPHPAHDRGHRGLSRASSPRRSATSSSPTTARSSTAARSCPARARRRSCT